MKIQFAEEQKFTQWWLWLILIMIAVFPIIEIYNQVSLREGYEGSATSNLALSIPVFAIIILFLVMKLKTDIDENEIRMNFFPLVKRRVNWNEVKTAQVVNYGFVGGWGIRLWTGYGTVYNTKGNIGLAIELKNGKKFVIGTQKETELQKILHAKGMTS